jgi:hypothetical protein
MCSSPTSADLELHCAEPPAGTGQAVTAVGGGSGAGPLRAVVPCLLFFFSRYCHFLSLFIATVSVTQTHKQCLGEQDVMTFNMGWIHYVDPCFVDAVDALPSA